MPTKYSKGTLFEREIKQWLERNSFYVIRSAGSHGLADLVAIPKYEDNNYTIPEVMKEGELSERLFPLPFVPSVIQIKSLGDDIFNVTTKLDNFLWSRELTEFRTTNLRFTKKYLFIFNSKSRKDIPYVFEFKDGNYIRIYINGFI